MFGIFYGLYASARYPSLLEAAGAAIGFASAVFIIVEGADQADAPRAQPASVLGDAYALICAMCFCLYILVAAVLRERGMPTFLMMCPANAVAALTLAVVLLFSGTPLCCDGPSGLLDGWASSGATFGVVIGMAVLPGLLGHGLMALSLTVVSPLTISLLGLQQVWLAMLFGAAVGAQGMPSVGTIAAAPVLMAGAALAIVGGERAKRKRAAGGSST